MAVTSFPIFTIIFLLGQKNGCIIRGKLPANIPAEWSADCKKWAITKTHLTTKAEWMKSKQVYQFLSYCFYFYKTYILFRRS